MKLFQKGLQGPRDLDGPLPSPVLCFALVEVELEEHLEHAEIDLLHATPPGLFEHDTAEGLPDLEHPVQRSLRTRRIYCLHVFLLIEALHPLPIVCSMFAVIVVYLAGVVFCVCRILAVKSFATPSL